MRVMVLVLVIVMMMMRVMVISADSGTWPPVIYCH